MRQKRPVVLNSKGARHSLSEQDRILDLFNAARSKGLQPFEAIEGLRASLASVYRWQRKRTPSSGMPPPTASQELSIEVAIERLADPTIKDRLILLEALFKFIAWLRWPNQTGDHPVAITVCVVSYLSQKCSVATVEELDDENIQLLQRHLRLDTLRRMFSSDIFAMPSFEPWCFDGQRYDRSDLLGDVAWFLLAYEPASADPRDGVSLSKAYYATQHKVFRHRWQASHRTFRALWLEYGSAAPFHYVERFHPSLEFTLNPSASDFAQSVDEILERRTDLHLFLARCRAATEMMIERLDRRAVAALRLPRFPPALPVEAIMPPRLPILTPQIMRKYGRPDKR